MIPFFAEYARLPDGWRRNVLMEWDDDGVLTGVEWDSVVPTHMDASACRRLPRAERSPDCA
ncbi:hypothetical protein P9239_05640 [Caballeronia sp. LZ062]|uniref:hypothetical protein n=1 Tax=unclassified Caballeronia TaxID=2646786 RepID=UPI00285AA627|nr:MULTISPECIES: hypothetical protein [unclassified Caballeronia]MDR5856761.1 hypothetical protein [Caballeronia sp. LZ050]MDR5869842.1 hypothetical protein [Caballeronia sp. LZ062]